MWRPRGWDKDRIITDKWWDEHAGLDSVGLAEDAVEAGADAMLKKVYEWGNEECIEHPTCETTVLLRRECAECWLELLKEL